MKAHSGVLLPHFQRAPDVELCDDSLFKFQTPKVVWRWIYTSPDIILSKRRLDVSRTYVVSARKVHSTHGASACSVRTHNLRAHVL